MRDATRGQGDDAEPRPAWPAGLSPVILAGLLLIWLIAAAIVWLDGHGHDRGARQQAASVARVLADQVDHRLRAVEAVAEAAATRTTATQRSGPRTAVDRRLEDLGAGHPTLQAIDLVSGDGRIVASSRERPGVAPVGAAVLERLRTDLGARRWVLLSGHDLGTATPIDAAGPAAPVLLAHARPVFGTDPRARPMLVVATVRLADLAVHPQHASGDDGWRLHLTTIDGRAVSDGGPTAVAQPIATGPGHATPPVRQALADLPLAVEVVAHDDDRTHGWWPSARPLLAAAGLASACLLMYAMLLARRQRERDAAQTASRHALERAARRDAELRALVDSLPEWMFRADATGRITFVNRRWRQLSGRDDAAAIGRPLAELIDERDAAAVEAMLAGADAGDEASGAPKRLVRLVAADGTVRELELSLAPMGGDGGGGDRAWAGYAVDVTEREAARRQVSEQYRLTEQLIDAMPLPLFLTDLRGDLLLANRMWVDWLGVGALDADADDGDGPDLSRVHDVIGRGTAEVIAHGPRTWPIDLPTPEGRMREALLTKVPLLQDGHGQPLGVIGTLVDVTEFREAERTTERARQVAEAASHARAEFVANVSHELRTPLQSIIGFAELGRDRSESGTRAQGMFVRIHESGRRMLRLVEDLLDVSRLGSPMGRIEARPTPLVPVVVEVVEELRALASSRGIALALRHAPELARREATLDGARYAQVLRNVIANAIRFSPPQQPIEIVVTDADGVALATVRDHGPGIPEDELDEIFEPFVQSTRTRDGSGGTGLGLAICRRIMQAHGGFVTADNAPRGGAVFRIGMRWCGQGVAPSTAEAIA